MSYGECLKAARKRHGLTQREVAHQLGVSSECVSRWECDRQTPLWSNAVAIWKLLGVSPGDEIPVPSSDGPNIDPGLTEDQLVDAASELVLACADADGAYTGTTADELVSAYVGDDHRRWSKLIRRVRDRAEEKRPRLFTCTVGAA